MITVLTPTYNRAYRLTKLYMSLMRQSCKDFEWILVDDGSTDHTKELYDSWNKDGLDCHYYYKKNGGKHTAVNYGVKRAKGDYIFIVDSDDYLTKDAICKVNKWVKEISNLQEFAGVSGLRGYNKKKVIGKRPDLSKEIIDCTNLERKKNHLIGDKAEIFKKEILLQYPFPEYKDEKYIPEDIVWNAIARDGYKIRWHNEIIYIGEYLEDGLTRGHKDYDMRVECFRGYTEREKLNVKVQSGFEKYMELGRYIDLVKKVKGIYCSKWIRRKLRISIVTYQLGLLCYFVRKYGKKICRGGQGE